MAQKKYVSIEKLGLYHEKEVVRVNGLISTAKDEAIAHADSLASNYDVAGAAATVQGKLDEEVTRAKAREDEIAGLVATAQGDVNVLAGKVGEVAEGSTVVGMIDAVDAKAIQNATDIETLEGKVDVLEKSGYDDTEVRNLISGLTNDKADKTQVATDIETAVNAEKSARETAVAGVQSAVDTLSGTHATDKKALEDAIALKADQTALNAVSDVANAAVKQADYDVKVKALEDEDARIVGLVEAEATKAREEEGKLSGRLDKVEAFFEGAAEDSEGLNDALDTLVEIQTYVNTDGEVADQMVKDIAANKKAIEDHAALNHDFGAADEALEEALMAEINKKADKTTVEGIDGRLKTAEGEIDTLQSEMAEVKGDVATKAEAQALADAVEALEGADTALDDRLKLVEAKFVEGDGSVEDMIADAIADEVTRVDGELAKKVDKVDGKGLSTNDLTNELKGQYDVAYAHSQEAHAPADAQKNIIETVKVNGVALTVADKAVDVSVPTDNTQLANGAGYLVASDIANKADKATTLAGYGIADAYTKTEVDTAVSNAIGQFVECSEEEINALFA